MESLEVMALLVSDSLALPWLQASAGPPTWVWAALLMAGFVGLTVLTVVLARFAVLRTPPPVIARDGAARRELAEEASQHDEADQSGQKGARS